MRIPMRSELEVILKAQKLASHIILVTNKSPKKYRYSYVDKLHNNALSIVELLYLANEIKLDPENIEDYQKRLALQTEALAKAKLLGYLSESATRIGVLLRRNYSFIAKLLYELDGLNRAWMRSDRKRMMG